MESIIENLVLHTASDAYWRVTVQIGFERLDRRSLRAYTCSASKINPVMDSDARK